MPKGSEWDRRDEDSKVRLEVIKTLGSVQTAIGLFEKELAEAKDHFEDKAQLLTDKIHEHEELLNGSAREEGVFQWLHQADRNIKALIMGVLGENGANYEKSLKGQVGQLREEVSGIEGQIIALKLQIDSLKEAQGLRVTVRGQNILLWVAVIGLLGGILGVAFKDLGPKIWERMMNPPEVEIPQGTPTPVPEIIKPRKKLRKKAAAPARPVAQEPPASSPRAPLSADEGATRLNTLEPKGQPRE